MFEGRTIGSYKLKGCGAEWAGRVVQPQETPYSDQRLLQIYIKVESGGVLVPDPDQPKPLGGLPSGRGRKELENGLRLFRAGAYAVIPVVFDTYPTKIFQGNPTEYVILGMDEGINERAKVLFESDLSSGKLMLNSSMISIMDSRGESYLQGKQGLIALLCLCDVAEGFGITLHTTHTAGETIRFSGNSGNYSWNNITRRVFLHDLDSCLSVDDVDSSVIGLQKVLDLETAIFGLFDDYCRSRLDLITTPEQRMQNNLFRAFLRGYFRDEPELRNEINRVAELLQASFERAILDLKTCHNSNDYSNWLRRTFGPSLTLSIVTLLMPIYARSSHSTAHPLPYGTDGFATQFREFQMAQARLAAELSLQKRFVLPGWTSSR